MRAATQCKEKVLTAEFSKAKALFPGASVKVGEWVSDWVNDWVRDFSPWASSATEITTEMNFGTEVA